jgi:hypothetical protein
MERMDNPTKQISYEILNPAEDTGRKLTANRVVAQKAYDRGFLVSEHEIIKAYLSTGQRVTTILTTEWRDQ